jgi:hypothetical protein
LTRRPPRSGPGRTPVEAQLVVRLDHLSPWVPHALDERIDGGRLGLGHSLPPRVPFGSRPIIAIERIE